MKNLLHMWRYPRMVSWFLVTIILFLLARIPFAKAPVIPFYMEFQPGIVLVPLVGVFWGPAGALGILAASFLGDRLLGLWGPLSYYRAMGLFLGAYTAKRLWDYSLAQVGKRGGLTPHWGRTIRFILVSWPACAVAAAWPALGADLLRLYPFSYFVFLLLLNHLVFTTLLAPALYRILARELVPHFGCWREVMSGHACYVLRAPGALLAMAAGVLACVLGILLGGAWYGLWPTSSFVIGTTSGPALKVLVAFLLLLQAAGLLMLRRTQAGPESSTPGGDPV